MLYYCYYFDDVSGTYKKISFWQLLRLEKTNPEEFLKIRNRLFMHKDPMTPMVLVNHGDHQGFRRKGLVGGEHSAHYNGDSESKTHYGNKDAIADLNKFEIYFNNTKIKLFVKDSETEKKVKCFGKDYIVDNYLSLERTEPEEYCDKWNGELYFEVCHRCPVDDDQAVHFAVENLTLFEYKVNDYVNFYENISESGYQKRKASITKLYVLKGIRGKMICQRREPLPWTRNEKGEMTTSINGRKFFVVNNPNGMYYGVRMDNEDPRWEYCKQKITTEEDAVKLAEYLAYKMPADSEE